MNTDDNKIIEEGKFFAIISYISFLCVISLLLKKDNKFALFHAKHGLVLFVAEVVVFIFSIVPFLGWLLGAFAVIVFMSVSIWGILQAASGNYSRLPFVSDVADNIVL
jgi:uncharacterized membrane protein